MFRSAAQGVPELFGATNMKQSSETEFLDTHGLALRTGIAASTWTKRRLTGDTPPFAKIGRRVLYRWPDVEAWLASRIRTSTSDAA